MAQRHLWRYLRFLSLSFGRDPGRQVPLGAPELAQAPTMAMARNSLQSQASLSLSGSQMLCGTGQPVMPPGRSLAWVVDRTIRQGCRELAYEMEGMLALGPSRPRAVALDPTFWRPFSELTNLLRQSTAAAAGVALRKAVRNLRWDRASFG
jgi:hypothetical protein